MKRYCQLNQYWDPGSGTDSSSSLEKPVPPEQQPGEFGVWLEDTGKNKIQVIRALRSLSQMDLREAKQQSESAPGELLQRVDFHTAQLWVNALTQAGALAQLLTQVQSPPGLSPLPTPEAPEEQSVTEPVFTVADTLLPAPSRGTVHLENFWDRKIPVIRVVLRTLKCSLRTAKNLVERAPIRLGEGLSPEEAEAFAQALQEAGATAYRVAEDPFVNLPQIHSSMPAPGTGSYSIELYEIAPLRKHLLLKALRDLFEIDLKEADKILNKRPVVLRNNLSREEAQHWVDKLGETEATLVIQPRLE